MGRVAYIAENSTIQQRGNVYSISNTNIRWQADEMTDGYIIVSTKMVMILN